MLASLTMVCKNGKMKQSENNEKVAGQEGVPPQTGLCPFPVAPAPKLDLPRPIAVATAVAAEASPKFQAFRKMLLSGEL